jgi:hypothetical protein
VRRIKVRARVAIAPRESGSIQWNLAMYRTVEAAGVALAWLNGSLACNAMILRQHFVTEDAAMADLAIDGVCSYNS